MKKLLRGKKTKFLSLLTLLYQAAYLSGQVPVSPDVHTFIMTGLGSGIAVALRDGIKTESERK